MNLNNINDLLNRYRELTILSKKNTVGKYKSEWRKLDEDIVNFLHEDHPKEEKELLGRGRHGGIREIVAMLAS